MLKKNKISSERVSKLEKMYLQEPFLTASGVFFGFPDCCVEDFINDKQFETDLQYPELKSIGTGYMPCPCCAKDVHENWPKFQEKINQNRFATSSFPSDTDTNELNLFFINFTLMLGHDPKTQAQRLEYSEAIIELLDANEAKTKKKRKLKY